MSIDEGYIKFHSIWNKKPLNVTIPADLISQRNELYKTGLIGFDDKLKVAYGNISCRLKSAGQFLISGTQTGGIEKIQSDHFTVIKRYDIDKNRVLCEGPAEASSETMTHAALYALSQDIKAVVHFHHKKFWEYYFNILKNSRAGIPYGTPEMAREIQAVGREIIRHELPPIIIMKGHEDGVIAFGDDLRKVVNLIHKKLMHCSS